MLPCSSNRENKYFKDRDKSATEYECDQSQICWDSWKNRLASLRLDGFLDNREIDDGLNIQFLLISEPNSAPKGHWYSKVIKWDHQYWTGFGHSENISKPYHSHHKLQTSYFKAQSIGKHIKVPAENSRILWLEGNVLTGLTLKLS